jgi:CubicO group peptidase (beta-lactamase class C family)
MGWNLGDLLAEHGVPGAQVAVLADGEVLDEAAGVLSLRTRVETTTDSVFKIGSITKVWTATLVRQLVDDGVLDLDRPVRDHLPGFRLGDPAATGSLTARHLLTHTGGVDGNHVVDTGRDDGALGRFVATLADVDHFLPPGTVFSYSNSGYAVLGRLVEVLRGKPFHAVLRERLVAPLDLHTVATDADEAILHRAAVGHVEAGGELVPTTRWAVSYSTAPSGSHLAMSARDQRERETGEHERDQQGDGDLPHRPPAEQVVAFRGEHLGHGRGRDGGRGEPGEAGEQRDERDHDTGQAPAVREVAERQEEQRADVPAQHVVVPLPAPGDQVAQPVGRHRNPSSVEHPGSVFRRCSHHGANPRPPAGSTPWRRPGARCGRVRAAGQERCAHSSNFSWTSSKKAVFARV